VVGCLAQSGTTQSGTTPRQSSANDMDAQAANLLEAGHGVNLNR